MIEKTYVFTIPESPKSINHSGAGSRSHHMAAHKEKRRWEGLYLEEFMAAKMTKGMEFCKVDVTIRFRRRPARADEENFRPGVVKPLADALTKGGYLKDDTNEWFQVGDFRFEFPQEWPYADPRIKHELIIRLEASYL